MSTGITVFVLGASLAAILTGAGLYRGWFRLAPIPSKGKKHFVPMFKKDQSRDNEKKAQNVSKNHGRQLTENVAQSSPKK